MREGQTDSSHMSENKLSLMVGWLVGLTLLSEEDDGRGGAERVGHLAPVGAKVFLRDVLDDEGAPHHGSVGAQLFHGGMAPSPSAADVVLFKRIEDSPLQFRIFMMGKLGTGNTRLDLTLNDHSIISASGTEKASHTTNPVSPGWASCVLVLDAGPLYWKRPADCAA